LAQLARIDLLAIDDFAIAPITAAERNDLLELLDDRVGTRATLTTSQFPVMAWQEWLNDPTLADAILDASCMQPTRSRSGRVAAQEADQGMTASRNLNGATAKPSNTACPPRRSLVVSDARRRGQACITNAPKQPPSAPRCPPRQCSPAWTTLGASPRSWTTEIR
jgi:hypothetical protein